MGVSRPYVLVIGRNSLGVTERFDSYEDARAWAVRFVQSSVKPTLPTVVGFTSISKLIIRGADVEVRTKGWSIGEPLVLRGWYDPKEPSHRAQVRRLINTLGFVQDDNSAGTYIPNTDRQDAVPSSS